jgi:hypothetical protein
MPLSPFQMMQMQDTQRFQLEMWKETQEQEAAEAAGAIW